MEEEIYTLQDASRILGINYIAMWNMSEFNVVDETEICEDLHNGLLYEWLEFISKYTDSYINNYQESVIKLFLDLLGDHLELVLQSDELDLMRADCNHAGHMIAIKKDENKNEIDRIPIRLKLDQYILFLEIGSK